MDCIVDPPTPQDPSYELFLHEKMSILNSLALRAKLTAETLNAIPSNFM